MIVASQTESDRTRYVHYFNFDNEGFDKDLKNNYTGWRAFAYYPFLGTFWPTNGSTDDVLIRLPETFWKDKNGNFNLYKILPKAISDYLSKKESEKNQSNSALEEITESSKKSKRSILDEITFENYSYYLGFDKLE